MILGDAVQALLQLLYIVFSNLLSLYSNCYIVINCYVCMYSNRIEADRSDMAHCPLANIALYILVT